MTILLKIEWVSKNTVFYFFPRQKKNTDFWNECVSEFQLFQEKKNTTKKIQNSEQKKIHQKMRFTKIYLICFLNKHLYYIYAHISWAWKFFGRKYTCIFFSSCFVKKKNTIFSRYEWVSGLLLFRGKNKIRYLCL